MTKTKTTRAAGNVLVRQFAADRAQQLVDELEEQLTEARAVLRLATEVPRKARMAKATVRKARKGKARRKALSPKQRKEIATRMRAYWADRRKAREAEAEEQGGRQHAVGE